MNEPQMIIQDDTELDQKIRQLMLNDATVHAAYKTGELLGMSKTKLYANLVILLANEKKTYFDMAVDLQANQTTPTAIVKGTFSTQEPTHDS